MNTTIKTALAFLVVLALIASSYFFIDRPVSEYFYTLKDTGWHVLATSISQAANHFFFNILIAFGLIYGAAHSLRNGVSTRSKHVLYLCLSVMAAMVVGDVLKDICGRARPPLLFDKGEFGFFPMAGNYLHYSFPSGHTLRIFSSMTALGYVIPSLRYPALLLATLVGCSRVVALKHYPSDVLFGAFIGVSAAIWGWKLLYPYGQRQA